MITIKGLGIPPIRFLWLSYIYQIVIQIKGYLNAMQQLLRNWREKWILKILQRVSLVLHMK